MYHHPHHQNQVKSMYSTPGIPVHQERQLFLQGGNVPSSNLVLSTDAKPRLKWTPELHDRFTEAVNQLGGAEKATPKTVMKLMGIPGLTLYHLKSHLQKYRLSKNIHGSQSSSGISKTCAIQRERTPESSDGGTELQANTKVEMSETMQMQMEVQRRLHEQLEVQRHLQLRIEAQGKYLHTILEKAQDTLGKQGVVGRVGLEDAKVELSELVSKVATQCVELTPPGRAGCSIESCLTSCEARNEWRLRPRGQEEEEEEYEDESARMFFPRSRRETIAFPIEYEKHQLSGGGLDLNARHHEDDNGFGWASPPH